MIMEYECFCGRKFRTCKEMQHHQYIEWKKNKNAICIKTLNKKKFKKRWLQENGRKKM